MSGIEQTFRGWAAEGGDDKWQKKKMWKRSGVCGNTCDKSAGIQKMQMCANEG